MEVNSKAKKCPYCHQWQSKLALLYSPQALAVIPVILIYLIMVFFFSNMFGSGENFTEYRDQIEVTDVEIKFSDNSNCGQKVLVLGTITNSSDVSWDEIVFDIQFYDANNNFIDTDQEEKYSFMILANDTSKFKVSMPRDFPAEMYDSCKIRVLSAKDASNFL
jgi:hypothetical protein